MREVSAKLPHDHVVDVDPEDPSQQLDNTGAFHIEPLAVDVRSTVETAEDFDIASAENVRGDYEELVEDELLAADASTIDETGELYGMRTPHAADTDLAAPEDRDAFEGSWRGETWLESLDEHATGMGALPEEEIVMVDDTGHHPTEGGERPVADKGSGGAGGR